ncbi:peptide chain release factor 2, partial [Patescibacteria group bacterium]
LKSHFCGTVFDVEKKKIKIKELEIESQVEGFWDDSEKAGGIMKKMETLKEEVENIEKLDQWVEYLFEFKETVHSPEEEGELEREIDKLEKEVDELEFKTLLSGEYDQNDVIVTINSGAGGVDAQDWAEMLMRMYFRWAEKNNFSVSVIDESRGQEAGIKGVTFDLKGSYAYGYLRGEAGVHRLVRLSPFNSDNLRQTSFASVEVMPVIDGIKEVEIDDSDLRVDTFRSSGAGGQSVNTTDSAVRITHLPTETVASCQTERSQLQNKERAMRILKAKLHQKYLKEKEEEKRKLRGEHQSAEWGSQIRSYVLHPYKMVKDHRTKHEEKDAEKVLEGSIDGFIESELAFFAGKEK